MDEDIVIICESGNISGHATVNMLWVSIVFKVLMVSIHCNGVLGAYKKVTPMGEASH